MTQQTTPTLSGSSSQPSQADLNRARREREEQGKALLKVRATAERWARGLGAVLAALVGFSLLKGRSDVGQLASSWAALVGITLLLSVVTGAVAVFALLSCQGSPWFRWTMPILPEAERDVLPELRQAGRMLGVGVCCAFVSLGLLLGAVGTTWYGPARDEAMLIVYQGSASWCGEPGPIKDGAFTLKTSAGPVRIEVSQLSSIMTAAQCPGS